MTFSPDQLSAALAAVVDIADAAGREIMRIYEADFTVTLKADRSPLTEADLAAQHLIAARLLVLTPDIPLLGEESPEEVFAQRSAWRTLWLVDPLDGTREFVKRNGEFTVNIALVHDGEPILGVVGAPAREVLYAGARGCGAFRRAADGARTPIHVQSQAARPLRVLGSRSHRDAELDRVLARLGEQERISVGSALKFGLLAEGGGDLYVRWGPTSEWDTAAGQAIVLEAGGRVTDLKGQALHYNQRATVLNPAFMAFGDLSRDWAGVLTGP
jgi:3'(2'), 5'-bisphosphate nucleotidase